MTPPPPTALTPADVARALEGDRAAARALFDALMPHVQRRVYAALTRRAGASGGRVLRQEVLDLTQEVFVALYEHDGRALRRWDPALGASLTTWVGRVAEHTVASILRSGRRSPWTDTPTESAALEHVAGATPSAHGAVAGRDQLARVLDVLRADLSPLGYTLFVELVVEQRDVEAVCAAHDMTANAVYVWRNRLKKAAQAALQVVMKDSTDSARREG
ncbi:MAG: sigma-70 family RNA polymerase sigma factor [Myxococcales bacterium]|nr:sigma-70 family RNA polymerase sigma factor [Myxococcales bacterium]